MWTFLLCTNLVICWNAVFAQDSTDEVAVNEVSSTGDTIEGEEGAPQSEALSAELGENPPPISRREHDAAVSAIEPRISGTWLIDRRMGGGECQIRRSADQEIDFEVFDYTPYPDQAQKLFRFLFWNDSTQQFQASVKRDDTFKGTVTYLLKLNPAGTELTVEMTFDEEGQMALEDLKPKMSREESDAIFQKKVWKRKDASPPILTQSRKPDADTDAADERKATTERTTADEPAEEGVVPLQGAIYGRGMGVDPMPKNSIQTRELLIIETSDGLSAYSTTAGAWARVTVGLPKDGRPRLKTAIVGTRFAVVVIDDQVLGFGSQACHWGVLKIPSGVTTRAIPNVGETMAIVQVGDRTYALSPTSGEWTSSDGEIDSSTATAQSTEQKVLLERFAARSGSVTKPPRGPGRPQETAQLMKTLAEVESAAASLAKQLRSVSTADETKQSPAASDLRQKLEAALNRAFDLKCQLEQ
ncbi:hypothetical protein [Schlesneria paludicola]|uniref:hypothetical protein n=1 Tax=Schlesneria paludicola TaxID=360056 RepID=UPI0004923DB2|nr:hypothetical protein [Schlesneria paludicola]